MKTKFSPKKSFAAVLVTILLLVALPVTSVFAATTSQLVPTGAGYIAQWAGAYTAIDEGIASASCSGGDYLTTITPGYRSSFTINLSSIPNGSTITSVNVLVADRGDNAAGGTYSTFIRLNGTNSSDSTAHSVTGTGGACTGFPNDSFTVTPTVKDGTTTLEIGVAKGNATNLRIGAMAAVITYTPAATPTTTTVASNLNPSTYGTSVTFTATVSPTPTNGVTVEFYDGASLLGTGTTSAGQATYSTAALTATGAGTHSITAKFLGNGSFAASTSSAITQTVNKKAASATPNAASKTYGGTDPAFSGTLSGFLSGDAVTATYSRTVGETVLGGPYTISAALSSGTGALGNYNITYNTANFIINPKDATVTPDAASKTYGDTDPALSGTLSGFLVADGVTAVYSRALGETVGAYAISATLSPIGVLSNYNIAYNAADLTINQKDASVTPDAAFKTYGDADPTLTGTLSGFLAGDGVTAAYTRAAGETVAGGPYAISATLSPLGVLGNYNITYNTADFTINQKDASVTPDAAFKTYGDADPTLTGTLSGFLPGDNVTAAYTRATGETVAGGPYAISATLNPLGVLGNYNITYNTADFTINQKDASVTPDAAFKTYGDSDPTLTGTLSGFLPGDGVTAAYSRAAGETVLGGPYTISATLSPLGVLGNYNITYNTADFTINAKSLTVTASNASKTYGDVKTFAGTEFSTSGLVNSDTVDSVTLTSAGAPATAGVNSYAIVASDAVGSGLSNYNISYADGSLTVDKASLSVTANNASKTYDKVAYSGGNGVVFSGFVNGEDEAALGGALSYGGDSQGAVNAGSYTIMPGGLTSSNYDITFTGGTLTIGKVDLTITAQHDDRVYNGGVSSSVLPEITDGALVSPDSATLVQSFDNKHVGTGKTMSAAASTISDGNGGANYNVTFVDDTTGAITAYDLEVTAVSDSKEYDGTTASLGAPTITNGVLQGSDTAAWTQTFDNKNADSGKTLTPAGAVSDGNGGLNYNVTFVPVSTGSITARALEVTAVTDTKEYDGDNGSNATPQITNGALQGTDSPFFSQSFDDKNVGSGKTLTPSGFVNDGNSGNNYVVTFVDNTTGEITIRAIEVTAATDTKTYDGTTASLGVPTITNGSLASGDTAAWTQTFDDKNVGVGKTLTASGSVNDGNGGANYNVSFVTALGNIDAAALTITANNKTVYLGGPTPAFDYTASGFVASDTFITAPTCAVVEDPHTAVGTYTIACSGGDAGANYIISYVNGVFTITDRPILTVTASSASITYGDITPTITASYDGFVDGDDAWEIDTLAACSVSAPLTVTGSPVATVCSGAVDDKYDFTYVNGAVTVGPKALTITAANGSKTYGDTKTFTGTEFTSSGLVSGDNIASVTLASSGAVNTATVGSYPITASDAIGTGLGNYTISYADGSLAVDAKALTVTAANSSKTYGQTKTFAGTEFTTSGLVSGDSVTSATLASSGAVNTAAVGSYNITASAAVGTGLSNYTISYVIGTLTVNKADLTVTAENKVRAFGAADPAFTFTLTGLVNGETAAVLDSAPTCTVSVAHGAPGVYPIVCAGGSDNNYNLASYVNGTLTVTGVTTATFADVPLTHWAWKYVETLYAFGITGGCGTGPLVYCPAASVTRDQMAVFLLKAKHGTGYTPPAVGAGTGFADVPTTHWAAAWIKQLAAESITTGCGGGNFCPSAAVTRDQMAVFLLKAKYGSSYTPPAVGASTGFADVPTTYWAAAWIKQLAAESVTGGCGGGNYCPTGVVSRDQMAVFLVKTFGLPTP